MCSDSATALMALKGGRSGSRTDLIIEIMIALHRIEKLGSTVGFVWVPPHVGVQGNEGADSAAKRALNRKEVAVQVQYGKAEYKSLNQQEIARSWQKEWEQGSKGRFYFSIQPATRVTRVQNGKGHCGDHKTEAGALYFKSWAGNDW